MIELRMPGNVEAAGSLTQVKLIAMQFPGEHELTVIVPGFDFATMKPQDRRLTLGPEWRYDASPACMAALNEFGSAAVGV